MRAINYRPDRTWRFALAFLPFALLCVAYVIGSGVRLAENPNDKLLPSFLNTLSSQKIKGTRVLLQ